MDEIDSFSRALKLFGRPPSLDGKCGLCIWYHPENPSDEPSAMCRMHAKTVASTDTCDRWDGFPF